MAGAKKILPNDANPFTPGIDALDKATQHLTAADSPVMRMLALRLEREIKLMLSRPGTGREYPASKGKGGRRRKRKASAPDNPPAVMTGTLRRSITHGVVDNVMRVGTNIEYAPWLEFGTLDKGGFVAPRPFMRPAWEKVGPTMGGHIVASLQDNLAKAIGGGA